MRAPHRGLTLTELLIVVSIIAILTAMVSPVLLNAYRRARQRVCMSHMRQIHMSLEDLRKHHFGNLPNCFDLQPGTTTVDEASWWYRKLARYLYPRDGAYDQLTVPRSDDGWWATHPHATLSRFPPDGLVLRCPSSRDPYDDRRAPTTLPRCYEIDKDRVYDDNFGYNHFGFDYSPSVRTIGLPDGPNAVATSYLYHRPNAAGRGGRTPMEPIRGSFADTAASSPIGAPGDDISDPAGTILLMDYIKADAQPFPGVDGLYGYRFRHGGRANVLFVNGHVESFRKADFLAHIGGPTLHWEVRRGR